MLLTQSLAAQVLCCGIRFLELEIQALSVPGGVEWSLVNELPYTSLHLGETRVKHCCASLVTAVV